MLRMLASAPGAAVGDAQPDLVARPVHGVADQLDLELLRRVGVGHAQVAHALVARQVHQPSHHLVDRTGIGGADRRAQVGDRLVGGIFDSELAVRHEVDHEVHRLAGCRPAGQSPCPWPGAPP